MKILIKMLYLIVLTVLSACSGSEGLTVNEEAEAWILDFTERYGVAIDEAKANNSVDDLKDAYVEHVCECYSAVDLDHTQEAVDSLYAANEESGNFDARMFQVIMTKTYPMQMMQLCAGLEGGTKGWNLSQADRIELAERIDKKCGTVKNVILEEAKGMITKVQPQLKEAERTGRVNQRSPK